MTHHDWMIVALVLLTLLGIGEAYAPALLRLLVATSRAIRQCSR